MMIDRLKLVMLCVFGWEKSLGQVERSQATLGEELAFPQDATALEMQRKRLHVGMQGV